MQIHLMRPIFGFKISKLSPATGAMRRVKRHLSEFGGDSSFDGRDNMGDNF